MMILKWIRSFIYSAGGILLSAAFIRFVIAAEDTQAMSFPEPMLGIPLCYEVLIVGGFELTVGLFCLLGRQVGLQISWLAWLASNYVVYRIGLQMMHIHPQATAIGSLTDPLHLSRGVPGYLMNLLPFYLVLGSYAALLWLLLSKESRTARVIAAQQRADQHDVTAGLLKIFCPSCGGKIKFPVENLSQHISCPHCRNTVVLRKPDNLKMSCFFCQGHIEFPVHALGRKISCPHCKMDITLKEPI